MKNEQIKEVIENVFSDWQNDEENTKERDMEAFEKEMTNIKYVIDKLTDEIFSHKDKLTLLEVFDKKRLSFSYDASGIDPDILYWLEYYLYDSAANKQISKFIDTTYRYKFRDELNDKGFVRFETSDTEFDETNKPIKCTIKFTYQLYN